MQLYASFALAVFPAIAQCLSDAHGSLPFQSPAKYVNSRSLVVFYAQCLEAEFYSWVANGVGLTPDVAGNGSLTATPSGGRVRTWDSDTGGEAIAQEIADNEIAHVKYLRAALTQAGATPVSKASAVPALFVVCAVC